MTPRTETFYRFAGEVAQDLDTAIVVAVPDPPPACRRDDSGPLESFVSAEAMEPVKRLLRSGLKSIHIAGVSGDVGRDAILLSLARTLAETGRRILVVDADVDGPPLAEPDRVGLTDVMSGEGRMAKVVVPSPGYEGMMAFLPIGRHADTLESPGAVRPLVRALEEIRPSYDVTLVSAPCLDRRGKVHPAATACEAVLLVLSPTLVSRDRIRRNFLQLWGVEAPLRGLITLGIPNVMAEVLPDAKAAALAGAGASEGELGGDIDEALDALDPSAQNGHDADVPGGANAETAPPDAADEGVADADAADADAADEGVSEPAPRADELPIEAADAEDEPAGPAIEDAHANAPADTPPEVPAAAATTPDDAMAEFERVLAEATEATRDMAEEPAPAPPPEPAPPRTPEVPAAEPSSRYSLPVDNEPSGEAALASIEARAQAAAMRGHRDPEHGAPSGGRWLSGRQRLALGLLAAGVVGVFAVWFWPSPGGDDPDVAAAGAAAVPGTPTPSERLSERARRAADPASGVVVLTEDSVHPGPAQADEGDEAGDEAAPTDAAPPPATDTPSATSEPRTPPATTQAAKPLPDTKAPTPKPSAPPASAPDERTSTGAKVLTMASAKYADMEPFYAVHITSFRNATSAVSDAGRLAKLTDLTGRTIEYDIASGANSGRWYRVIMGQFATIADAERAATRIKRAGITDYARVYRIAGR